MGQIDTFLDRAGWADARRAELAGDASARRYMRLSGPNRSAVLMIAPPQDLSSFNSFVQIATWLRDAGFSAPEIWHAAPEQGLMLMEDFGDRLMANLAQDPTQETVLYTATCDLLSALSEKAAPPGLPILDAANLSDQTGISFDELEPVPDSLKSDLQGALRAVLDRHLSPADHFALRDLHAENIIWLPNRQGHARLGLLDFQDAVMAPLGYDLASLVDDPRRDVPHTLRADLITRFCAGRALAAQIDLLSLARNLRILGIFHRVAQARARPAYLAFLPRTIALIRRALERPEATPLRTPVNALLAQYERLSP